MLAILIVATVSRFAVIPGMTSFEDEITWLAYGDQLRVILADGPARPEGFGKVLQHPGVPVAAAAWIASLFHDEHGDRVEKNQALLARGRFTIVWTGIFCCVFLALLAARIYGPLTGGLAGLLLAISPFHIANSVWLQCDASLALFTMLTVLTFSIFVRDGDRRWLYVSGASCGLAIASKMPGVALVVAVGLVFFVQWIRAVRAKSLDRWVPIANMLRWGLTALVVLYLVWPRMWLDPTQLVKNMIWAGKVGLAHRNYFLGEITTNPAWYYYLVVVPFRLSSVELLGLAAVVIWGGWSLWKGRRPRAETWILLLWGCVFSLVMSAAGKKLGARYLLPLWPIFAVLIARFCVVVIWPRIASVWQSMSMPTRTITACLAALVYLAGATASIGPRAPDLFAYANPLLGGLSAFNAVTMVTGVAEKRVGAYLDTLPENRRVLVAGHTKAVRWHTSRPVEDHPCADNGPVGLMKEAPDYLVVFSYYEQRCPMAPTNEEGGLGTEIQSFVWDGAILAHVHQLRDQALSNTSSSSIGR